MRPCALATALLVVLCACPVGRPPRRPCAHGCDGMIAVPDGAPRPQDATPPDHAALVDGPPRPSGWRALSVAGQPPPRAFPQAVWTGDELFVWGGIAADGSYPRAGGRYDPRTDAWRAVSLAGAPGGRVLFTALWTGSEVIVWGGNRQLEGRWLADGARYDPRADSWRPLSAAHGLAGRESHTAVWTGHEMIVWGGYDHHTKSWLDDGARYDPLTDRWRPLAKAGAPKTRNQHTAVWTGGEMIVWGGNDGKQAHADGARYDPRTDRWAPIATPAALGGRRRHTVVWTGREMIVWGGYATVKRNQPAFYLADGGAYDPARDLWRTLAPAPLAPRLMHVAAWTGQQMIVWGGSSGADETTVDDGARYDPAADAWARLPPLPAGVAAVWPAAAWTGSEVVLGGGLAAGASAPVGARLLP